MTWRTEARQTAAGLEGSISRLFVSSACLLARAVAGRLGTWLNCLQPAKANKDCRAAYEKRLGQRFPFAVLSPSQLCFVHRPLLSCILTSLGISWTSAFASTAFISTSSCWTPPSISLNRTLDGHGERAARRQGSPGRVCLASSRVACRLRHVRRRTRAAHLSDLHLQSCLVVVCGRHVVDDWL
jgi:hypothetical protein